MITSDELNLLSSLDREMVHMPTLIKVLMELRKENIDLKNKLEEYSLEGIVPLDG